MNRSKSQRPEATAAEEESILVAPAAFKPVDANSSARKPWLKPATAAVLMLLGLLLVAAVYVFTAKSVLIRLTPPPASLDIDGGLALRFGDRFLMRQGDYLLRAAAPGYRPLEQRIHIDERQEQELAFEFRLLPGRIDFGSEPEGATVLVDGIVLGTTPLWQAEVEPGERRVEFRLERYRPSVREFQVEGRDVVQQLHSLLEPAWAEISLNSAPAATVLVDGAAQGQTPIRLELLEGEYQLQLAQPGYKGWSRSLQVRAGETQQLGTLTLQPVDGLVNVVSRPEGANVTVNDEFRGQTPLALELQPGTRYRISLFKAGFEAAQRNVEVRSGAEQRVEVALAPILAEILVVSDPPDAEVYVNNQLKGRTNARLALPVERQQLEIRKPGYATHTVTITPRAGLEQRVEARLKTLEQAKWENIEPVITTGAGQSLKLLRPGAFTMGASRREAGRRANEALRNVRLTRPFYLGLHEVTNQQFRLFRPGHSSGNVRGNSLNGDAQPVVNISWEDAAAYCNWLSARDGLPLVYKIEDGKVTGFDPKATGYRLPTEAEWAWAARAVQGGELRYPWGENLPPPAQAGNFADLSAAPIIGRILERYQDNYVVSAPVGSFAANHHGLFDMSGNAAEWVNDYYDTNVTLSQQVEEDPLGPVSGNYRVIRGSSWAHGTITELRLSFRDFGLEPRNDLGFRLARFVE